MIVNILTTYSADYLTFFIDKFYYIYKICLQNRLVQSQPTADAFRRHANVNVEALTPGTSGALTISNKGYKISYVYINVFSRYNSLLLINDMLYICI